MDLKIWLKKNKLPQKKFAKTLGYSYRYIHGIIKNEYIPSRELAIEIEKITGGEIKAHNLIFPTSKGYNDDNSIRKKTAPTASRRKNRNPHI